KGDDFACVAAAKRCVSITERTDTYITLASVWGSLPWDLLSLSLWRLGMKKEALEAVLQAEREAPNDERIRKNRILMQENQ
ncbi:MAG: hypothetical protein IKM24_04175, partial [Clostridia bacterium]|nr:hypothetical protein [Clostridia bacterium]